VEDRIRAEIKMLQKQFPNLTHGEQLDWVLIPELTLPADRFNKSTTKILFLVPVGYPQTGPNDFFVDADLRLKDKSNPPAFNVGSKSSAGSAPIDGDWGWFSWHPQSWRPTAKIEDGDNLVGFVRSIKLCLRGEESA